MYFIGSPLSLEEKRAAPDIHIEAANVPKDKFSCLGGQAVTCSGRKFGIDGHGPGMLNHPF
jgi:hypothetical protein